MPVVASNPPSPWHVPVEPAAIVRPYREVARFAAGGHRGIDLRATPGRAVRAPCAGRVTFRGAVAGGPPTVTIDCGRLRATLQRVAASAAPGSAVSRGARVGVATGSAVDLSARRPDGSYLDPAGLLGIAGRRSVPVVAVRGTRAPDRRPTATRASPPRPADVADRALVSPRLAPGVASEITGSATRADLPLGAAGGALMALVAACWALARARRRRRAPIAARGAGLARVQR